MILAKIKQYYIDLLIDIYPIDEINSIFKLLVADHLKLDAAQLILESKKDILSQELAFFKNSLKRLKEREPIQYILGKTIFCDHEFYVTPAVLIPRPETEELVNWILKDSRRQNRKLKIIDMGTGSGCIAISLAKGLPQVEVWAMDISKPALEIAKRNAILNDVSIRFLETDILNCKELPTTFDIVVSNPPYVKHIERSKMHDNVLAHEPKQALFVPDKEPLLFYDKITNLAKDFLNKQGVLYFEINQAFGDETKNLIDEKGFGNIELRKDFLGKDRMIKAQK